MDQALPQPRAHLEAALAGHQHGLDGRAARARPGLRPRPPAAGGGHRAHVLPGDDRRDRRPARPPSARVRPGHHHVRRGEEGADRGRARAPRPGGRHPDREEQPRPGHLGVLHRLPGRARERRLRRRRQAALQEAAAGQPERRRSCSSGTCSRTCCPRPGTPPTCSDCSSSSRPSGWSSRPSTTSPTPRSATRGSPTSRGPRRRPRRSAITVPFDDNTPLSAYGSFFIARPEALQTITGQATATRTSPTSRTTATARSPTSSSGW